MYKITELFFIDFLYPVLFGSDWRLDQYVIPADFSMYLLFNLKKETRL